MARLLLGFVGLKPARMKCRAPPHDRLGIGFPCGCRVEVRTGFFDAQLELPYSAEAISFGLGLSLTTCPVEIGQAARKRITFEFGCACLALQLG